MPNPLEAALFVLVKGCRRCAELGIDAAPGQPFGLRLSQGGVVRGIWSERGGRLAFRNLAGWHFRAIAETPEEALRITVEMAERNSWLA